MKTDLIKVDEFIKKYPYYVVGQAEREGDIIKIQLPNANNEWTFEVMKFAKKFIKTFPNSYIDWKMSHAGLYSGDNYLAIRIS